MNEEGLANDIQCRSFYYSIKVDEYNGGIRLATTNSPMAKRQTQTFVNRSLLEPRAAQSIQYFIYPSFTLNANITIKAILIRIIINTMYCTVASLCSVAPYNTSESVRKQQEKLLVADLQRRMDSTKR